MSHMIIPHGVCHMPVPAQRARQARLNRIDITENPYPLGSKEALEWMSCWFQEKNDEEEAVLALVAERGRLGK